MKNTIKNNTLYLTKSFRRFLHHEAFSGVLLLVCAAAALIWANSPAASVYEDLLHIHINAGFGVNLSLLHWINDGLMAVFFFVIGLEIKREVCYGELKSLSATVLPITAAIGGMIVPAILYTAVTYGTDAAGGWGIPMATDIAFSLGILAMAGSHAPRNIAVFLTALAIVDDLGAIIVIALFYNSDVSLVHLGVGLLALAAAFILGRLNVKRTLAYVLVGAAAWYAFYSSGIHPTIAGVVLGFCIPSHADPEISMLHHLERRIHPWSAYGIMPVFALANAGVSLEGITFAHLLSPIALGVILGLFIGKPIGVFGSFFALRKLGVVSMPAGAAHSHFLSAGALAGIGFTMSLFIASLAFDNPVYLAEAKLGILTASVLSGAAGYLLFQYVCPKKDAAEPALTKIH